VIWPFKKKETEQEGEEIDYSNPLWIFSPSSLTALDTTIGAILSGLPPKMCLNCSAITSFDSELHYTWYNYKHLGYHKMGPLCKKCWNELPVENRLELYRKNFNAIINYSEKSGEFPLFNFKWEEIWNEIEKKVREGK